MSTPAHIAVTGAAGQIGYSLLFRLAAGELLGPDKPIVLHLLEIPQAMDALNGVVMELNDCAFPLLQRIEASDSAKTAFKEIDFAFLVGARPRGPGMERKDLLEANAEIFSVQGKALNDAAKRDVKVLVTGNPANTNALIAIKNAPDLDPKNFSALTRLDHNRALSLLAEKCGVPITDIKNMVVWGNHSATQYPDITHASVRGASALSVVDQQWFAETFIPTVQQRGAAIIKARGQSSAASAANASIAHMRDWVSGSGENWISMAIYGENSYGFDPDLVYSYPVKTCNGEVEVIKDLQINDFSRDKMIASETELKEERDAVKHLL